MRKEKAQKPCKKCTGKKKAAKKKMVPSRDGLVKYAAGLITRFV